MSKTVLVTGASGFIGKFVVPALTKQGWQVRAAARDPNSILAKPGIEIVAMPDLKDAVDWAPLLDGVSHVLHLAGIAHAPGMLPDDAYARINAESVGASVLNPTPSRSSETQAVEPGPRRTAAP